MIPIMDVWWDYGIHYNEAYSDKHPIQIDLAVQSYKTRFYTLVAAQKKILLIIIVDPVRYHLHRVYYNPG